MNASDHIAQPEPARNTAAPPLERPESAHPHASDPPIDDPADSLDIDELLPVAFDPAALRVAMGPDLVELLRAAEERLDSRGESSHHSELEDDNIADVPVPPDVIALLAEPLEADDDDGATGAALSATAGATAHGGRPPTRDFSMATSHGQEEDLEQPLPRAPDVVRETVQRALTAASRGDATPFPEPPGGSRATGQPITDEHPRSLDTPLPPATDDVRDHDTNTPAHHFEKTPAHQFERSTPIEHRLYTDRGPIIDVARGPERDSAGRDSDYRDSLPRDGGYRDSPRDSGYRDSPRDSGYREAPRDAGYRDGLRDSVVERLAPLDSRHPAERPISSDPRISERAALTDRQLPIDRPISSARIIERIPVADTPRAPTQRMIGLSPMDILEPGPRSRASAPTEAVPAVLGPGDAPRAFGRAIASRISGALLLTAGDDQRRIVLHDGDVVTSGSSAPLESLVAFLSARGDIDRDLVPRLAGKLPPFGRHAGAALVAHGYLGQDDLWPVLRAHAEWVMGRALLMESGVCEVEPDPPLRYKAEPGVFGGATGAEVFVEAVRRVITPEVALGRLGGAAARLAPGPRMALLAECALPSDDEERIRTAAGHTVREVAGDGPSERCSVLYALLCLDVIDALPAIAAPAPRPKEAIDPLDEEAIRAKVKARLALVEEGDYFALLGVPRSSTSYEIRRAYLDLRRTFEPSRMLTASTANLADDVRLVVEVIEEAYEILRDNHRRERYRRAIEGGPPR